MDPRYEAIERLRRLERAQRGQAGAVVITLEIADLKASLARDGLPETPPTSKGG